MKEAAAVIDQNMFEKRLKYTTKISDLQAALKKEHDRLNAKVAELTS